MIQTTVADATRMFVVFTAAMAVRHCDRRIVNYKTLTTTVPDVYTGLKFTVRKFGTEYLLAKDLQKWSDQL